MVKALRWSIVVILLFTVIITAKMAAQDTTDQTLQLLNDRSVTIRPLEDVTQTAAQILNITATSARLHFVGKVPLACTVVFGTTQDFGDAAVDTNMNGGAIIEHNPVMTGLKPDTEYYYRLQGSGEDGVVYISEIGNFRTLPETTPTEQNLLAPQNGAQVMGVSSNFGNSANTGTWGILNAFDNDPNTAWASNGDGSKAWFQVKLAKRSHITRIQFWSRVMTDKSSEVFQFTVTTDSGAVYGPFKVDDATKSYSFPVDFDASTLRFDMVDSSGGNTGALEVGVFGTPAS